jgi:quercetin dioxygenase-like cupin family protein
MSIIDHPTFEPMLGDPDDHRPDTRWAILVDPASDAPFVDDITAIAEVMAPGDRIPLHTHPTSEFVYVIDGSGTYVLGAERREIGARSAVFIPRETPHALENASGSPLELVAMYPSGTIGLTYLDRNAAPGTEGDDPQPSMQIDPRTGAVTFPGQPSL